MVKKVQLFFFSLSFILFFSGCNEETSDVFVKLDGNISDGQIELLWTIDGQVGDVEYEIYSKINGVFEKIAVTKNRHCTVDIFSMGTNCFYVQYNEGKNGCNTSNVLSLIVEDVESSKNYFSDIQALYTIKEENRNSPLIWEFEFDDFGRPIALEKNGGRVGFSDVNGKKRVTWLNLVTVDDENKITSFAGLKELTALTELLCANNQAEYLDVSNNKKLKTLICPLNQLKSLNIEHNTALEYLYCASNQLNSLNVEHNKELKELYCEQNQLTSLDCSANTNLRELDCSYNLLPANSVKILNDFIENSQSIDKSDADYLFPNKDSDIYSVIYN